MPEPTLRAVADHGDLRGDTLSGQAEAISRCSTISRHSVSTWTRCSNSWKPKASTSSRSPGEELLATVDAALAADRGSR